MFVIDNTDEMLEITTSSNGCLVTERDVIFSSSSLKYNCLFNLDFCCYRNAIEMLEAEIRDSVENFELSSLDVRFCNCDALAKQDAQIVS